MKGEEEDEAAGRLLCVDVVRARLENEEASCLAIKLVLACAGGREREGERERLLAVWGFGASVVKR